MYNDKGLEFISEALETPEKKLKYIEFLKNSYDKLTAETEVLSRYLLYTIKKALGEHGGDCYERY